MPHKTELPEENLPAEGKSFVASPKWETGSIYIAQLLEAQWMLIFGKFTCVMAMALAILSVNSTCGFTAYQPDVPESLNNE